MAVVINDTCINCGACIDECPVEAIVDEDDNPTGEEVYYVYADKCASVTTMSLHVQLPVRLRVVSHGMKSVQAHLTVMMLPLKCVLQEQTSLTKMFNNQRDYFPLVTQFSFSFLSFFIFNLT